jgi:hypothetical protein
VLRATVDLLNEVGATRTVAAAIGAGAAPMEYLLSPLGVGMSEAVTRRNDGDPWTDDDVQKLRGLADGNTPAGVMSIELGRTEDAIRSKAATEGISLSPPNRAPYGDMGK